ncbi:hypothetical protein K1T71_011944 [Dendrolimus kikuchii]|uniref:Uncharacterized protein n=1 Tax=Dendrolimus kikuchii TaxID=765133 RepID=A0ACC1CMG2_9NEOP|nr:hypothetical protein K1T71_011944 [Dendrolimus kikuchii]
MDIVVDKEKCENKTKNIRPESSKRKTVYLDRLINSLHEFAQNCTLHGVRYIADKKLRHAERWFWTIVVLASISICGFLIRNVWVKWESSIIITLNETPVPANSVYYPSLTICPQIKIRKEYIDNETAPYLYEPYEINRTQFERYTDIAVICDYTILSRNIVNYMVADRNRKGIKSNHYHYNVNIDKVVDMALDFEDMFESCKWDTYSIPCQSLFRKVLIKDGVCYTTNVLDEDKIIRVENGVNKLFLSNRTDVNEVDSIEGYLNDSFATFEITLRQNSEHNGSICKNQNIGFFVHLQDPIDMPKASIWPYAVKTNQIMSLALKFDSVYTSQNLKSYPVGNRKCYFSDERHLNFFVIYTKSNCRMECVSNYTKELCTCVAFYMPHDNKSIICSAFYRRCIYVAETLILNRLRPKKIELVLKKYSFIKNMRNLINRSKIFSNKCHCLPACNKVNYDAEVMIIGHNFNSPKNLSCTDDKVCGTKRNNYKYSRVQWNYKRSSFVGTIRSNTMVLTDVIAQSGFFLAFHSSPS